MEFHRGRLIDHVHLRVKDLGAAADFMKLLGVFDISLTAGEHYFFADELWVDVGDRPSSVHLAFQAPDRETVGRFHAAGWRRVDADMVRPANANIIRDIMLPTLDPMATISRPFIMPIHRSRRA